MRTQRNFLRNLFRYFLPVASFFSISVSCKSPVEKETVQSQLKIAGSMHRVMKLGDLSPTIDLDTIVNKTHLYGVGPLDSLNGEIMVVDGHCYVAAIAPALDLKVTETFMVKAPFFVYANVSDWDEVQIPDSVTNDENLENFITTLWAKRARPSVFKLATQIDTAKIHVVGSAGQSNFLIVKKNVDVVGFFSTNHQGVFTHHDSFVHMHLITDDKLSMGHVDYLRFNPQANKLFISKPE